MRIGSEKPGFQAELWSFANFFFPWDLSYFQNVRAGVAHEWTKSFGFHSWTSHSFVFWDKDTLLLQCQSPWQNYHLLLQPRQVGISVAWWCKHWNKLHISWEPQEIRLCSSHSLIIKIVIEMRDERDTGKRVTNDSNVPSLTELEFLVEEVT